MSFGDDDTLKTLQETVLQMRQKFHSSEQVKTQVISTLGIVHHENEGLRQQVNVLSSKVEDMVRVNMELQRKNEELAALAREALQTLMTKK
ncbi:hypothetical protein CBR_g36988 [Chara braunii]|uniref:Uncharacterized protein n=1 Tax=Chara braunii TaxID=69332 RepID=A0A388JZI2_CHABU|nr:hypothetical protein CBR_g36988 [Chara braunii]|eukprot:GBG63219.1 hypothetical protein CBR_g36988 [Chara braunii]